eukprot:284819849_2
MLASSRASQYITRAAASRDAVHASRVGAGVCPDIARSVSYCQSQLDFGGGCEARDSPCSSCMLLDPIFWPMVGVECRDDWSRCPLDLNVDLPLGACLREFGAVEGHIWNLDSQSKRFLTTTLHVSHQYRLHDVSTKKTMLFYGCKLSNARCWLCLQIRELTPVMQGRTENFFWISLFMLCRNSQASDPLTGTCLASILALTALLVPVDEQYLNSL